MQEIEKAKRSLKKNKEKKMTNNKKKNVKDITAKMFNWKHNNIKNLAFLNKVHCTKFLESVKMKKNLIVVIA